MATNMMCGRHQRIRWARWMAQNEDQLSLFDPRLEDPACHLDQALQEEAVGSVQLASLRSPVAQTCADDTVDYALALAPSDIGPVAKAAERTPDLGDPEPARKAVWIAVMAIVVLIAVVLRYFGAL